MYRIKTLNKISSVGLSKLDTDRFPTMEEIFVHAQGNFGINRIKQSDL